MATPTPDVKTERLAQVEALIRDKVAPASREPLIAFARECFRALDADDLGEREAQDLYGAALSLWNLAQSRAPGTPRVRVVNPTVGEHGWQSRHTIVEIVNDDMPFLVDSVTMEINRHALALHLIIHPTVHVTRGTPRGARRRSPRSPSAMRARDRANR